VVDASNSSLLRRHRALFFVNVVLCAERILCRLVQYGIRNTGPTASLDHSACAPSVTGNTRLWNNTSPYKIFKNFWLEMEVNFTPCYGGNGKIVPTSRPDQTLAYLTPGLVLGRFRRKDRLSFTVGGGFEIAATSFQSHNHIPILSIRFPF
jgi:hypothetical protein